MYRSAVTSGSHALRRISQGRPGVRYFVSEIYPAKELPKCHGYAARNVGREGWEAGSAVRPHGVRLHPTFERVATVRGGLPAGRPSAVGDRKGWADRHMRVHSG